MYVGSKFFTFHYSLFTFFCIFVAEFESKNIFMLVIFKLLGSLALLMFGMKSMSEALQKMAGPQLRHVLGAMTTNRFTGMLTGMLVTASVQSSTATTVMTVSFVNAGLLTLAQAISVIMGANIGTTLTAWIMSAGMSFDITSAVYPAFFIGIILIYLKRYRYIGDFLFGLSFLLLGLGTLRMTGTEMNLGENQALLDFFASFDPTSFVTTLIFLLLGGILTFCVQSSAAVMAITMILCSSGALPIYQGIALVMGENIGTTVTSNLAAETPGSPSMPAPGPRCSDTSRLWGGGTGPRAVPSATWGARENPSREAPGKLTGTFGHSGTPTPHTRLALFPHVIRPMLHGNAPLLRPQPCLLELCTSC